ncbi:hypothetical protein [Methylocystis suflitae]|uniref:hypothetical protein n=1 Tax=Methylocystis suflitae TaxID=2951405 RepID=UPI00210CAD41|nr:hypothetical protein [Methylocystis suflitae]MCQ4188112.1 hypothetical protein [Methylocystis suflitae]
MNAPLTIDQNRKHDDLREELVRGYLIELLQDFESLSISAREALWRRNDALAAIHIDQLRLVGREIVSNFRSLQTGDAK